MQSFEVRPSARDDRQGVMKLGPLTLNVALGRTGIGSFKREGDGHTPRAALRLLYGFWRSDRVARPVTRFADVTIARNDGLVRRSEKPGL